MYGLRENKHNIKILFVCALLVLAQFTYSLMYLAPIALESTVFMMVFALT